MTLPAKALEVCGECIKNGGDWLHLRTCQTCGVTLCCDSSPMKHASKHAREAGHPVVIAAEVRGVDGAFGLRAKSQEPRAKKK